MRKTRGQTNNGDKKETGKLELTALLSQKENVIKPRPSSVMSSPRVTSSTLNPKTLNPIALHSQSPAVKEGDRQKMRMKIETDSK